MYIYTDRVILCLVIYLKENMFTKDAAQEYL